MSDEKEIKKALKAEIENIIEDMEYYGTEEDSNFMANPTMFVAKWMNDLADVLKEIDKL